MSTLNSGPSPSKTGTSTKRPYEVTTPSNLGTPRETTSNLGRSPGPSKKPRPNGEDGKELSQGGQWMIVKLDELQRMYKEVLLAATAVIQYQTYSLKLGRKGRSLPIHLERRVKITWGNFEATRRQVQTYMREAAQDASTPSSKHLPIPVSLPPPSVSLKIPNHDTLPTTTPLASPIPLSASTMLSFPAPPLPGIIQVEPVSAKANEFDFNILPTLPSNNGLGNLDLSNMNMSDFAAMIANSGFDYTSTPTPTTNQPLQPQIQPVTMTNQGMQIPNQNDTRPNPNLVNTATRTQEQSDTDRLLAQLGAFTGSVPGNTVDTNQNQNQNSDQKQTQSQSQSQQQPLTNVIDAAGEQDVDALLASLNDNSVNDNGIGNVTDFTNFDFSDIDLSNLGDMSGLFNTSTVPDTIPGPLPDPVPEQQSFNTTTNIPADQQSQPQPPQLVPPAQTKEEPTITASIPTDNQTADSVDQNPVDPNLDLSNVFDDSQAIDLDDFNFGNGDEAGEGGIDLTGDEFENLLAAFN